MGQRGISTTSTASQTVGAVLMKSSKQGALKHINLNQGNWHTFTIHNGLEKSVSAKEIKEIEILLNQAKRGDQGIRVVMLEML